MSRRLPVRSATAALLGLAVVVILGVAVTSTPTITVSSPVLVGDLGLVNVNNSPQVVRNPQNPNNLVIASRVDRPGFSAAISATTDGGRTWTTTTPPLPAGLDRPFAPSVAFGPEGLLHVVYSNLAGRGNTPEALWHASSNNGGRSFGDPVAVTGAHPFQPQLVIDQATGALHVTWLQAEELALLAFPGSPRVVAARSNDEGATWSDPVPVSDPDRQRVGAAVPVITGNGRIVVVYKDFGSDRRDWENLDGPPWDEPFAWVVASSADGGATFDAGPAFETNVVPTRRFLPFLPEFPGVAANGQDGVVVVWADGRNGDLDVFLRRSSDGGQTWTDARRVNDNPLGDGTSQYLPAVSVDGERLDVAYLDRRDDPTDVMTTASLALSQDGGATFDTLRLSQTAFDARIGASAAPHLEPDFGSRLGINTSRDGALVAWPDTTLGDQTTGRQDVATRAVHIAQPPMTVARAGVISAVLLVLGLVLVAPRLRGRGSSVRA